MPIKTIHDLIMQGIKPERVKSLPRKRFSERIKKINPKYSTMSEVVPPLNRGDFLHKWKDSNKELDKVRKERDDAVNETKKLKNIMNTTWSKDWKSVVNEK
jgi:ribosomal protein L14E/L6E/L27E|tara:strand:+ start:300 stop:602 length:303 start_codon:yes stop_codon:yes gene_type:complete